MESLTNSSFVKQGQQTVSSVMEHDIRDVKRAAALLAITKIKLADLPYTMHCGINGKVDENESYMDVCIQTRLEGLYNDFNDVMNFHVMLVGGAGPYEGRVEIIFKGRHGTVCDYWWSLNDAAVACKMLGYNGAQYPYTSNLVGNGTGEILLDRLQCTGDESSLLACKHRGIGGDGDVGSYCHHGRDASVVCKT